MLLIGIAMLLVGFGFKVADGAVPHVGAGRLRGRADADHGVHGGGGEGGGVRRVPPRLARGVPVQFAELAPARSLARHRDDDRRQRDRRSRRGTSSACSPTRASRTPAIILVAHRGRHVAGRRRRCCSICSPTRSRRSARSPSSSRSTRDGAGARDDRGLAGLWRSGRGSPSRWRCSCSRCSASRSSAASGSSPSGTCSRRRSRRRCRRRRSRSCSCSRRSISAGYYLYVVMVMFMRPRAETRSGDRTLRRPDARGARRSVVVLLVLGVVPDTVVRRARKGQPECSVDAHPVADRRRSTGRAARLDVRRTRLDATRPRYRADHGAAPRPRCLSESSSAHGHLSRNLSAVRHSRHRRQGSDRRGRAGHRPRVRRVPGASTARHGAVVVGRDNRPSGAALRDALVDGLTSGGVDVVDIGVVPTPLNYWALHHLPVVGGIQITGSHNPPEYNGFKLSHRHRVAARRRHPSISTSSRRRPADPRRRSGTVREEAVIDRYVDDIVAADRAARRGRSASSTTAATAPARSSRRSCSRSSASTAADCSARATARFRTIIPIRPFPRTSRISIAAVKRDGAEIGIAFDGDADRIGVVDERRRDHLGRSTS